MRKRPLKQAGYDHVLTGVVDLLEQARRVSAHAVNSVITATYWEIGRRIVEFEQGGEERAEYGTQILQRMSTDLNARFGRGFGVINLRSMRRFFLAWPEVPIRQTLSVELESEKQKAGKREILQILSAKSPLPLPRFPLPWSHYVLLMKVEKPEARSFYETEALRGGWTVRQLDRQINTLFFERTLASRNKAATLEKGGKRKRDDVLTPEEEIKDPLVLEFLGLKDEYSESDLEEALIHRLQDFLLELGGDFTFVGRQKRLRIDDEWYRVDLVFFHRRLKCLVVIDLKLDKLTHADIGQMHMYLNYAKENWTNEGENPPVGLILCTKKGQALAKYALDGLPNKVLAAEYRTLLPDEKTLVAELERSRRALESPPNRFPAGR